MLLIPVEILNILSLHMFSKENQQQAMDSISRQNQLAWFFNDILKCYKKEGFEEDNIEVLGKGDLEPLQEAEEFGEAVNRRVEVFFISN